MRSRPVLAAAAVAGVAVAGLAIAQSGSGKPLLHEELPRPTGDHAAIGAGKTGNPTAIAAGDKTIPKPAVTDPKDRPGTSTEPVLGQGGFAADRDTSMKPDENTGPDSTLHYVSVFNPDVLPFKRMSTFDAVGEDETLRVAHTVLTELAVGGSTDPRTRDRFYGDVLLQLKPGVDIPLPSVAPDMRILSYEAKPRIALKFEKDGADNFYVRSDEASASGTYRLVFYADADAGYFAPSLPARRLYVRDVAAHAPPELRASIPPNVLREARVTLGKLGIDENYPLDAAFNKLVNYFRAFQAGTIKHPTGDTYRDLCDSQAGVCRHRAFAFMITANALGIPTRFVENEAHAFVEVWFPDRNWQRIDLGGAALRMDVTGADNKTLHRPRADDPFSKPPEYRQQYTQLEGEIHGLSDQQIADKRRSLDQSPPSGAVGSTGTGGGTGPDRITPDQRLQKVAPDPRKATPTLVVTRADETAYRGDLIHVEGSARANGQGLADRRVEVFLSPAGKSGSGSISLGYAVTGADGTFRADLPVPAQDADSHPLNLATYEIVLSSVEDAYYNAALSD